MLPIVWRATALDDLTQIIAFVANENHLAAERLLEQIEDSVLPAAEHPYLFRTSRRVPGLREVVAHPNYIVLYRVAASCVEVVNVVHARREYP